MVTGVVEPKLNLGRFVAPAGLLVMAAVRATEPVKPPDGVILIMEVLPLVEPGDTVTVVPLKLKLGVAPVIT